MTFLTRLILWVLRLYRAVSAGGLARCRFYPTCSAYAQEALERDGLVKGTGRSLKRLLRCHPWHAGGYDPVFQQTKEN